MGQTKTADRRATAGAYEPHTPQPTTDDDTLSALHGIGVSKDRGLRGVWAAYFDRAFTRHGQALSFFFPIFFKTLFVCYVYSLYSFMDSLPTLIPFARSDESEEALEKVVASPSLREKRHEEGGKFGWGSTSFFGSQFDGGPQSRHPGNVGLEVGMKNGCGDGGKASSASMKQ